MHDDYFTDEWWNTVHRLKAELEVKVKETVDEFTKDLRPDIDEQVRSMITETYRFWRD
jgi:hypothetical protein